MSGVGAVTAKTRVAAAIVVVAVTIAGAIAAAAELAVDEAATATAPATRGVQWDVDASCDLATVEALAARHGDVGQFVVLSTDSFADTVGTAFVAVRTTGGDWRCQTEPVAARFGRAGTRPLLDRRSRDGTTPAGVFPLGSVSAWDGQRFSVFGNRPDPGVRAGVGYRAVRNEDCWGATPGDPAYNHLVARPGCPGPDDEWLARFGDVYAHAAVIGANLDPISGDEPGEPPYAAAIFLHRHSYAAGGATRPTSGCVSLALEPLVGVVRALDPTLRPHFAVGPADWLRSTA